MKINFLYKWVFFLIISLHDLLNAVLDGRTIPIYLDTRYAFTNYEWAKGRIYFRQGFDLPVGGTVFIETLDLVNQDIALQGGTLVLKSNLRLGKNFSFKGKGFFDLNGYAIKFQSDLTLSSNETLYFISSGALIGEGDTIISPGNGALICTNNLSSLELSALSLYNPTSANFVTTYNMPQTLVLNRSQLIISHQMTFTLSSRELHIKNLCSLMGWGKSKCQIANRCSLIDSGQLYLLPGATLVVNAIKGSDITANVVLDSASLEYTTTEENFYLFSSSHPTQPGLSTMSLYGKNRIIIPSASIAQLSSTSKMLFRPGSQLTIPKNSHFIIL